MYSTRGGGKEIKEGKQRREGLNIGGVINTGLRELSGSSTVLPTAFILLFPSFSLSFSQLPIYGLYLYIYLPFLLL